jgi:preprotein translocase subunit YajC
MANELWIEARHIQPGDKVTTEDGRKVTVQAVRNGIYRGHVMLDIGNGEWSEVARTASVQIDRPVHAA